MTAKADRDRDIREARNAGLTVAEIADYFGLTEASIYLILKPKPKKP